MRVTFNASSCRRVAVRTFASTAVVLIMSGDLSAQPPTTQEPVPAPPEAPAPPAPPAPVAAPMPPSPGRPIAPGVIGPNVRVEVAIKDHRPESPVVTKVVSVVVADKEEGRVRTMVAPKNRAAAPLNVDARPFVHANGRILLRLALQYDLGSMPAESDAPAPGVVMVPIVQSSVNETIAVVLDNGKPMVVTQSADPLTDRKVTVEVTATILK